MAQTQNGNRHKRYANIIVAAVVGIGAIMVLVVIATKIAVLRY
jgi:hypothetical protein